MAKRAEKDQWDRVLDQIDFKGLTQEEVLGQGGLIKHLTGNSGQWKPKWLNIWAMKNIPARATTAGTAGTGIPKRKS
jgi:hypothetical protein